MDGGSEHITTTVLLFEITRQCSSLYIYISLIFYQFGLFAVTFDRAYVHLEKPTKMPINTSLYLFRDEKVPAWEVGDPLHACARVASGAHLAVDHILHASLTQTLPNNELRTHPHSIT